MKKVSYLVLFLFISLGKLSGQDYLPYYHLCNDADEQIYLKDYDLALEKFDSAFSKVPYVHNLQYIKASKCAILSNQHKKAYEYICQLKKQGNSDDFFKKKPFKTFQKSHYYELYKDSIEVYEMTFQSSIHKEYTRLIDSLHHIDQNVVRKNYIRISKEKRKKLMALDQEIFEKLLELIDEYGFPSEQLLGRDTYFSVATILLHNLREPQNQKYHAMALKAVKNGAYLPSNYAYMYEVYCEISDNGTYYMTFNQDLSEGNIARIDKNRKEIGLPPLSSYFLKNNGRTMNFKWGRFK